MVDFTVGFNDPEMFGGGNIAPAIERTRGLLAFFRAQRLPVAFTRVVYADDGSDAPTRERLDRLRPRLGFPLRHVWHPHEGFRKCTILNAAIAQAEGEYLFFTDGDCIPRRDVLAVHAAGARRGRFISGGYLKLPLVTSERITKEDVLAGRATDHQWLRANGTPRSATNIAALFLPAIAVMIAIAGFALSLLRVVRRTERVIDIVVVAGLLVIAATLAIHIGYSYQRHLATGWRMEAYPRYYLPLIAVVPIAGVSLATGIENTRARGAFTTFLIASPLAFAALLPRNMSFSGSPPKPPAPELKVGAAKEMSPESPTPPVAL